jgi:hypothetical protein
LRDGGAYKKMAYDSSGVSDLIFREAINRGEWITAKEIIEITADSKKKVGMIMEMPTNEIPVEQIQIIANDRDALIDVLLRPVLEKMSRGEWRVREEILERVCSMCDGKGYMGNIDAPLERDVDWYPCNCNFTGKEYLVSFYCENGVDAFKVKYKKYQK